MACYLVLLMASLWGCVSGWITMWYSKVLRVFTTQACIYG